MDGYGACDYVPPAWPLVGYGLRVVTAPAQSPVTLQEAKDHLYLADSLSDADVGRKLAEAVADVERESGRALCTQTWTLILDDFPGDLGQPFWWRPGYPVYLPLGPVQSISSVKYYDADGVQRTLTPTTDYYTGLRGEPAKVVPAYGKIWPVVQYGRPEAVEIQFVAGYGDPSAVPLDLKKAVKLILGAAWRDRGDSFTVGLTDDARSMPAAARRLIANHRYAGYR